MRVVYLGRDLMMGSRIAAAADAAGASLLRVGEPSGLPPPDQADLVLVDWSERQPEWAAVISKWCALAPEHSGLRLILFGPHVDLDAHADARAAGLGPMMARSWLVSHLAEAIAE
ncbi:MAG: hypothetical protein ABI622_04875 [Chloroflexota bacterium]